MQVAWKPVPFLSVLPICVTNTRAGFIAICSISVFSSRTWRCSNFHRKFAIKESSNFQNMHFVRVSCTFCQKNVQIVFSFSTCQIVRVGWGGDDNVPWTCTHVWCYAKRWLRDVNILWTCTHVWCYANWWLRDDNILWTCTHVWCYANWWLRDVNILWPCTHVWCYANWWLRDVNILWPCTHVWCYANWWPRDVNIFWTCTHVWCYANWWPRDVNIPWTCTHDTCLMLCELVASGCYANSLCAQKSGKVNSSLLTYCRQWQWRNAHVLCKDLMATTGKAFKHWRNLQLGVKNRTGFQSAGMLMIRGQKPCSIIKKTCVWKARMAIYKSYWIIVTESRRGKVGSHQMSEKLSSSTRFNQSLKKFFWPNHSPFSHSWGKLHDCTASQGVRVPECAGAGACNPKRNGRQSHTNSIQFVLLPSALLQT